jgi:hypothetical protein
MAKYKYTYQDWVDGNVKFIKYGLILFGKEVPTYKTASEDSVRISTEQNRAFLHILNLAFESIKRYFIQDYNDSVSKDEFIDYNIRGHKLIMDAVRSEHEDIATDSLFPGFDGRFELTKSEVDNYLSLKADSDDIEILGCEFIISPTYTGIEFEHKEKAPFFFILRSNIYNWLIWFKRQQELKNLEPSLNMNPDRMPRGIADLFDKAKEQKSYTWIGNDDELPKLYNLLLENKLIHPDTTEEQFEAVFTAKPLGGIVPIRWHEDNASELLYFVLELQGSNDWPNGWLIEKEDRSNYKRLTACFAKTDSKQFTENFKQAKQNLKNYGLAPAKKQIIDIIIKQF